MTWIKVGTYTEEKDGGAACRGAADAIAFLNANGFTTEEPIRIHMVMTLPVGKISDAFGFFDRRRGQVYILSFSSCRERHQGAGTFSLPIDRDLHRSFVVHEIAHATASHNFSIESPTWAAQEYIAYVTQLATMHPRLRKRVLAHFSGPGFENSMEISSFVLAMAPNVFAVKAYQHFVRPGNGMAFFRRVLTGDVRFNHGLDRHW